jgi:hypothetical protein
LPSQASSLPKESFESQHIKLGNLDKDTVKKLKMCCVKAKACLVIVSSV